MPFTAVILEPSCLRYSTFNFVVKLFNNLTALNISNLPGIYVCAFSERFISTVYFSRTDFRHYSIFFAASRLWVCQTCCQFAEQYMVPLLLSFHSFVSKCPVDFFPDYPTLTSAVFLKAVGLTGSDTFGSKDFVLFV